MEMLRLAMYPPSMADQDTTKFAGFPVGCVDKDTDPRGKDLYQAKGGGGDEKPGHLLVPVLFLRGLPGVGLRPPPYDDAVDATRGNLDMVRGLLDAGVEMDLGVEADGNLSAGDFHPLSMATQHGHEEIVDLLLERGTHVNYPSRRGSAIVYAAVGGSLAIVRKLLAQGALARDECCYRTLQEALIREHTKMAELLLRERPEMDPRVLYTEGKMWWKSVLEADVDSMVDMMRERYRPEDASFWVWLEAEHARLPRRTPRP
ncbi:hypothetical protein B0T14DRAFT_570368 [Immersiella caudata]|uniref:Uncharacterized protein n=1 Tax=Immersiella caudata TaxID=314043 RepID=A0AA39WFH3_9PEZI|nr:hypothetical protein B0T14DRAFT_570368 [Immersiella caudata]